MSITYKCDVCGATYDWDPNPFYKISIKENTYADFGLCTDESERVFNCCSKCVAAVYTLFASRDNSPNE